MTDWVGLLEEWERGPDVDGYAMSQSIAMMGRPIGIACAIDPASDGLMEVEITYVVRASDFDFAMKTHSRKG